MRPRLIIASAVALGAFGCKSTESPQAVAATAASVQVVAGASQTGAAGVALAASPSINVLDTKGGVMAGVAISVTVTAGGGSIANAPTTTAASGPTALGTWTLGKVPGVNTLTVTSGSISTTISATGTAGAPAKLTLKSGGTGIGGVVATALSTSIVFQVQDQFDNPVPGVTPVVTVGGGGSYAASAATTDAAGSFVITRWTLGTVAGQQTLSVSVGANVPAVAVSAATTPAAPARLVVPTAPVTALAGATVASPLSATVQDQFSNPVAGQTVTFAVQSGGGSIVGSPTAVTNASGIATAGQWQLGGTFAAQSVRVTSGTLTATIAGQATSNFQITTRFVGNVSTDVRTRVASVVNRVRAAVVGHVADTPITGFDVGTNCAVQGVADLNETIHDLVIFVQVMTIDGPGITRATGGPCQGLGAGLPSVAVLTIDDSDIASMEANGTFETTVLHEMLHCLGFGVVWSSTALLNNSLVSDPRFMGTLATAAFAAAGGTSQPGVPVQVINAGQVVQHWRTSVFVDELMTSTSAVGQLRPMSAITLQSLADIGYTVNLLAAEPYVFPGPAAIRSGSEAARVDSPLSRGQIP